jgi:D-alanyl-lipoteichoic acid acyltransferase DltB (MBOAT superfamily)
LLFNSIEYFLFFALVFLYQWYVHPFIFKDAASSRNLLHIILLVASYFFYMSWDYRFGSLIFISTLIDYYLAIKISESDNDNHRLRLLQLSLFLNLIAILGFFKYYNFAASNLNGMLGLFGFDKPIPVLKIILPVGISFFTFQSLSYTIDVYRKQIECERSFIRFALFVSFFPQLVAGPIVTAKTFLPQLYRDPVLEEVPFRIAIRYFILGYIKKVIISDNISPITDLVYKNPENYGMEATWLAATLFTIQIYCDFSGYSDMAYGSALLLGYQLPENFRMPFMGTSFTAFWKGWHISLSVWMRDYVYISLGGSRLGYFRHKFNLFFTMLLAGLWHGANWTFLLWGGFQGLMLAIESIYADIKKKYFPEDKNAKLTLIKFIVSFSTFILTFFMFIFISTLFRIENLEKEKILLTNMVTFSEKGLRPWMVKIGLSAIAVNVIGHIAGYFIFIKNKHIEIHPALEFSLYVPLILIFSLLTSDNVAPFIYFQF